MMFGHAMADYPLQGDFLAKAKNRTAPIPGVPWIHGLFWHSVIHGGFVGLITGSAVLGVLETWVHMVIDDAKCAGWFSLNRFGPTDEVSANTRAFHVDQILHVACKVLWVALDIIWVLP
jgi:hypothetical protein